MIHAANIVEEDTTAEFDAGDLAAALRNEKTTKEAVVVWAGRSDIGRQRENNEDKFDFFLPDDPALLARRGRLWAVADGMGGHNAGQIASEAALKTIIRTYFADAENDADEALRRAVSEANTLLVRAARDFPDKNGMGTTVVVAVAQGGTLTLAHVGDSRAYLLRGGDLRQITSDHSWVEEQVRRGGLTRAQAEASPYRNVITRSVGMGETVQVDVSRETLRPGDLILLCSDGLSGYLDGPVLAQHLQTSRNPSQLALALIDAANDAGGRDNVTALVLRVDAAGGAA